MKLLKWKTGNKPRFPHFVEKLFGRKINENTSPGESVGLVPFVNVEETGKAIKIDMALPGADKKDIQIKIDNGLLTIYSEKQYKKEDRDKNYLRQEFGYAAFQRMFELPEYADTDKVDAKMKNGILHITIGKKKTARSDSKTIKVN